MSGLGLYVLVFLGMVLSTGLLFAAVDPHSSGPNPKVGVLALLLLTVSVLSPLTVGRVNPLLLLVVEMCAVVAGFLTPPIFRELRETVRLSPDKKQQ